MTVVIFAFYKFNQKQKTMYLLRITVEQTSVPQRFHTSWVFLNIVFGVRRETNNKHVAELVGMMDDESECLLRGKLRELGEY